MRFFEVMRGALIAAPISELPVTKMPLQDEERGAWRHRLRLGNKGHSQFQFRMADFHQEVQVGATTGCHLSHVGAAFD